MEVFMFAFLKSGVCRLFAMLVVMFASMFAVANTAEAGLNNIAPIGLFPAGASLFGIQDMIGNIFEWTSSLCKQSPYGGSIQLCHQAYGDLGYY